MARKHGFHRPVPRGFPGAVMSSGTIIDLVTGNLMPNPDAFDSWTPVTGASVSANVNQGVNGLKADLLTEDSSTGGHFVQTGATTGADDYQFILYAKTGTSGTRGIALDIGDNGFSSGVYVKFAIDGTIVEAAGAYGSGYSAVSASSAMSINGYRAFVLNYTLGGSVSALVRISMASGTSASYAGDGSSSLYLAGATLKAV